MKDKKTTKQSMMKKCLGELALSAMLILLGSSAMVARAANFPDYNPATLGSYWTYQNAASPYDTYTVSVFESFTFAGQPAMKLGTDAQNYGIAYNDGVSVTMYGYVANGVLYETNHVSVSTITDGMFYQIGESTNYQLLRMWDNLDPALKAAYNIDSNLKDLLFIAAYDSRYAHNSQNATVESNLTLSLPDYAVTHLEWYQIGVGLITTTDVSSNDGAIGDRYDLIDYKIAANAVSEPSLMLLLSFGLACLAGLRRRFNSR